VLVLKLLKLYKASVQYFG